MKPLWVLFGIVFLVTFFGSVLCHIDDCPHHVVHRTMNKYVMQIGNDCAEMGATPTAVEEFQRAASVEDYRRFFRGYCQRQEIVRECLANATKQYEMCRHQSYVHALKAYGGFIETLLDIECTGDDRRLLATFWGGLITLISKGTETEKIIEPCLRRSASIVRDIVDNRIESASKVFIFYNEVQWFKGCILQAELDKEFKDDADKFLSEIVRRMKCLNPQDNTLELCGTIDPGLIKETSACSLKNPNEMLPMYDALEDQVGRCFNYLCINYLPPFVSEVNNDRFDIICYYESIDGCLDRIDTYSKLCLNLKQQQEFKILRESLKSSYRAGCSSGDDRIKNVLLQVFRLKTSGQGHALWDCVDVVKSTRNVTDEHGSSSKNMRFYHELDSFKTCLVNKLHGDQTSVEAATSLIDEMMGMVECLHPGTGTRVLCKSILS